MTSLLSHCSPAMKVLRKLTSEINKLKKKTCVYILLKLPDIMGLNFFKKRPKMYIFCAEEAAQLLLP